MRTVSFVIVMVVNETIANALLPLKLFRSMYLAGEHACDHQQAMASQFHCKGTIIFGGGPVVTPLLREYVVQPGWVSTRDFLIGLAIIQALPGPNFNCAPHIARLYCFVLITVTRSRCLPWRLDAGADENAVRCWSYSRLPLDIQPWAYSRHGLLVHLARGAVAAVGGLRASGS